LFPKIDSSTGKVLDGMYKSAGKRLWQALAQEKPLQIVGTINAYSNLLAEKSGFRVIYLSGAGVANASYVLPDLGMTTLNDVLEDALVSQDAHLYHIPDQS